MGLCNKKPGIFEPLSHFRSQFIPSPTGSRDSVKKKGSQPKHYLFSDHLGTE